MTKTERALFLEQIDQPKERIVKLIAWIRRHLYRTTAAMIAREDAERGFPRATDYVVITLHGAVDANEDIAPRPNAGERNALQPIESNVSH